MARKKLKAEDLVHAPETFDTANPAHAGILERWNGVPRQAISRARGIVMKVERARRALDEGNVPRARRTIRAARHSTEVLEDQGFDIDTGKALDDLEAELDSSSAGTDEAA